MAIPAYKLIPGTGFCVDGFKYSGPQIKAYFLTHAHSDHYTGITDTWSQGRIFCSEVTGKLIVYLLGVNPTLVHTLPMNEPQQIQGVEVTLVDANHCPGAIQYIFRLPGGASYLHCGDMRFAPHLLDNPHMRAVQGCTGVFLDTTYCNPKYLFPPQEESVQYVASTVAKLVQDCEATGKRRLFLIQTYVIGKERVLLEVSRQSGKKIYVTEKKMGCLQCIDLPGVKLEDVFTTDPRASPIHVMPWGFLGESWPFFRPNFVNMEQMRAEQAADEVVGFVPTGWMYEMKKTGFPVRRKGPCHIHLVPYSEHSSYAELRDYVRWLRPAQIIPTVGIGKDDDDGKAAASQLKHFRNLVNETASKARFLSSFKGGPSKQGSGLSGKGSEELSALPSPSPERDGGEAGGEAAEQPGPDHCCIKEAPGLDREVSARDGSTPPAQQSNPKPDAKPQDHQPSSCLQSEPVKPEAGAVKGEPGAAELKLLGNPAQLHQPDGMGTPLKVNPGTPSDMMVDEADTQPAAAAAWQDAAEGKPEPGDLVRQQHDGPLPSLVKGEPGEAAAAGGSCQAAAVQTDAHQQEHDSQGGNLHGSQEMAISDAEEAGAMDPEDETALRTIAFAEADKTPNGSQDSNGKLEAGSALQTQVQQLQAVLGDAVAGDVAQKLIRAAGGSVERAVNNFYDPAGPQIAASGSMQPRPMSSAPGKGTKRAAASKPSAKSGAAKKLKGAPRISGQRSIRTFFGSSSAASQAASQPLSQLNTPQSTPVKQESLQERTPLSAPTDASAPEQPSPGHSPQPPHQQKARRQSPTAAPLQPGDDQIRHSPAGAADTAATPTASQAGTASEVELEDAAPSPLCVLDSPRPSQGPSEHAQQQGRGQAAPGKRKVLSLPPAPRLSPSVPSRGAKGASLASAVNQASAQSLTRAAGKAAPGRSLPQRTSTSPAPPGDPQGEPAGGAAPGHASGGSHHGQQPPRQGPGEAQPPQGEDGTSHAAEDELGLAPQPPARGGQASTATQPLQSPAAKKGMMGTRTAATEASGAAAPTDAVLMDVNRYDPDKMACWQRGSPVPYLHIARGLAALDSTTKRLRIGDALANIFRAIMALSPGDTLAAAYLASGRLAPDFENLELKIGGSTVAGAITEATGVSRAKLHSLYNKLGDLGDVAQACRHNQTTLAKPTPLTVAGVYRILRGIAAEKGSGSVGRKQRAVLQLLRSCREEETRYLVRTLVQNLRVGASWRSLVPALGKASLLASNPRPTKAALEAAAAAAGAAFHLCPSLDVLAALEAAAAAAGAAFHLCPSLDVLVPALLEGGVDCLEHRCSMTPGIPLKPMLAKICEGIPDALRQLEGTAVLAEYKYDGQRAQIHLMAGGQVRIFSRNCEDRTPSFPDVADIVRAAAVGGVSQAVLDAELVAVDRADNNRFRAFQDLSTRARGQVAAHEVTVQVCVFAFDLLYADGQPLVKLPLRERRARMAAAFPSRKDGHFEMAHSEELPLAGEQASLPRPPAPPQQLQGQFPTHGGHKASGGKGGEALEASGKEASTQMPHREQEHDDQDQDHGHDRDQAQDLAERLRADGGSSEAGQAPGDGQQVSIDTPEGAEQLPARESRVSAYLMEAFAAGTEGLMLKALDGPGSGYQPSKRSESWLKLKKDYCEGLRDSLDLVPIGAWHGNGRKVGWLSPFLLAAWDPVSEQYQSVCRCMSGFTDAFYTEATARLKARQLPGRKPYFNTGEHPDLWFEPGEVWEIRGADLTISPVHMSAVGRLHPSRGVSMRFPRFIRIRDDKKPEDASGPDVIADLYNKQTRKQAPRTEAGKGKVPKKAQQEASPAEVSGHEAADEAAKEASSNEDGMPASDDSEPEDR